MILNHEVPSVVEGVSCETLRSIFRRMIRIRTYEETIAEKYPENKMRCPTHLSTGQEAVPAIVGELLSFTDLAVSTHRSHAHYLGKGGSGPRMLAEIYGKSTGCAKGKGGSMHLIDLSVGFKGSTAIVGNTIPIGVGLALSQKLEKTQNLTCIFLGDAAVEEGVFYEAVNFAALKKLPVLFACENNQYSVYSHLRVRQPEGREIFKMVSGMGVSSDWVDGNDVVSSYKVTQQAIDKIRNGQGPQFIEYQVYRWREHCGPFYDNHIGYRTEAEFNEWKAKEPILQLEAKLLKYKVIGQSDIQKIKHEATVEVSEAFRFAEESPFPNPEEAFRHIYKDLV